MSHSGGPRASICGAERLCGHRDRESFCGVKLCAVFWWLVGGDVENWFSALNDILHLNYYLQLNSLLQPDNTDLFLEVYITLTTVASNPVTPIREPLESSG
ncbi:hypothetical protein Q8A67_025782 [Cirrhinus molitorella]|uniref:Uncharacterized protein n=1 Tax=Cirrhinus molitorella TaxID=172907 RepID=A0AA88NWQ5_9TELE|nr:hypothetical protein Q8A67_025782 [Cirrhinus molitorella]